MTAATLVVWYLIVYRNGSMVVVPQLSKEQCVSTANWINSNKYVVHMPDAAFCVPGK